MNNKGFTLVEIIAVIVIIGLLGLVTVPLVSNSIENSRRKAYRETINGIISAAKIYRANNDYIDSTNEKIDVTSSLLEYEHKSEIVSGYIQYSNGVYVIEKIKSEAYCATGTSESFEVYDGDC